MRNVTELLEKSADAFPERPAVVEPSGRSLTYSELNRKASALAGFLIASGVTRGDRVGLALSKSLEAVISLFGIMRAGAAYVPVDVTAPIERGRAILEDCAVRALIVESRSLPMRPDPARRRLAALIGVGNVQPADPFMTSFETAAGAEGHRAAQATEPSDLAYLLFTSGSTGVPKGVMISHGNVLSFLDWASAVFTPAPEDRFSSFAPFHFDPSILDIYLAIKHGATIFLIPEELAKNPKALAAFIETHRLTVWTSTPSILTLLVEYGKLKAHDASSLRLVLFGGEVFPVKPLRELQRFWPTPVFYNLYGPTETTNTCTFFRIPARIPPDREIPYPIGFACSHGKAIALDKQGREILPGQEGELCIGGPSVFQGYWNRSRETSEVFFERGTTRWYKTGDMVRYDPAEGFTYVGRKDRQVKRRGYRIELGEIEQALYLNPRVQAAAVVAVPDAQSGIKIVAFLACRAAPRPSLIALKTFCGEKLPGYMIPDQFVILDKLPQTSTGKNDYQALLGRLTGSATKRTVRLPKSL